MKRTKSKKPRQAVVVAPPSQVETEEKTVVWQHEAAFQARLLASGTMFAHFVFGHIAG
jgi:hypothetical protein